jgi:hypothetical protein
MKGPLPPDKEKSEIRNPESKKNEPQMKHGFNTDSIPCSILVPSVAANSDFEFRASKFGTEPSPQLLQILEGYLNELEHGAPPNPEELLARHPDLADE